MGQKLNERVEQKVKKIKIENRLKKNVSDSDSDSYKDLEDFDGNKLDSKLKRQFPFGGIALDKNRVMKSIPMSEIFKKK